MKYESTILKRLIDTYGVVGNPRYISEIIKEFIVRGKERFPELFTYQADWLAHIDEFGLNPSYTVSYTGHSFYAPNTLESPVKSAILKGSTKYRDIDTGEFLETFEEGRNLELVSVRMPVLSTVGKNLFNFKTEEVFHGWLHNGANFIPDVGSNCMTTDYIQIKENVRYSHNGISMGFYDHNKKAIGSRIDNQTIVSPSNAKYMRVTFEFDTVPVDKFQYVIGEWSGYEPYKSNILTVNEVVTLRGIGDVKDELNCLIGEVTERIGEVVLDGSEEWAINNSNNEGFFSCSTTTYIGVPNGKVISDKLPSVTSTKTEGVMMGVTTGKLLVSFNRDKTGVTSLAKFKEKLAQLQLKVCYEIENVDKTVDLSVKDQDNQVINQLSTFEGGTHFTTSSQEGSLLPTLTVDVVTDLEETLNLCSTDGNTL